MILKHDCDNPLTLARRMYWLAWKACGSAMGMGVLQERGGVEEAEVWERITGGGDSTMMVSGRVEQDLNHLSADYIFGRMMKCSVGVGEGCVFFDPEQFLTPDYQEWVPTYPTYQALAESAAADLRAEEQEEATD